MCVDVCMENAIRYKSLSDREDRFTFSSLVYICFSRVRRAINLVDFLMIEYFFMQLITFLFLHYLHAIYCLNIK